jgi:putative aldouronate transport system permease protein
MSTEGAKTKKYTENRPELRRRLRKARPVYFMILPVIIYFLIFYYWPLYWLRMAFYDFSLYRGFSGSTFVGLENFRRFVTDMDFWKLIRNVLVLNTYSLIFCFPAPILFALLLNELRMKHFRKAVQAVSYLPHFISMVAFIGLISAILSPSTGILAHIVTAFGGNAVYYLGHAKYFRAICVISGIWQETGWASIVYLSAMTAIDPDLYEAAMMDGADRFQRLLHITVPCISTTIIIMLILKIGTMMSIDFEKVYLLQNSANLDVSEMIQTWVYKRGLIRYDYSLATAAGLFNSLISLVLVAVSNRVSRRFTDTSLW